MHYMIVISPLVPWVRGRNGELGDHGSISEHQVYHAELGFSRSPTHQSINH